jgi:hypothetical protein
MSGEQAPGLAHRVIGQGQGRSCSRIVIGSSSAEMRTGRPSILM